MPTIEEVCNSFDLTDVDIEFTEEDFQNLTTYKLFQQHVRPILQKENPKVPMSKLMMLVAAKWREFSESNPHLQDETKEEDDSPPRSPEYTPKPSRSRSSKSAAPEKAEDYDDEDEDDDEPEVKSKRSKRNGIHLNCIYFKDCARFFNSKCSILRNTISNMQIYLLCS